MTYFRGVSETPSHDGVGFLLARESRAAASGGVGGVPVLTPVDYYDGWTVLESGADCCGVEMGPAT